MVVVGLEEDWEAAAMVVVGLEEDLEAAVKVAAGLEDVSSVRSGCRVCAILTFPKVLNFLAGRPKQPSLPSLPSRKF